MATEETKPPTATQVSTPEGSVQTGAAVPKFPGTRPCPTRSSTLRSDVSLQCATAAARAIGDFVLYAERNLLLKARTCVRGGNLGVRSIAQSAGAQMRIGEHATIEVSHDVYSPSISLGRGVTLGRIFANDLNDDGITLGPVFPFPALTMPALPLAPAQPAVGADITVAAGETAVLRPGTYGCLFVLGRLDLLPGNYAFTSVLIGDGARIFATRYVILSGDAPTGASEEPATAITRVSVRKFMSSGRAAIVAPSEGDAPGRLQILVAGADTPGRPAVSFGERSEVRAILMAPHGTMALADHIQAAGAFAAFDIAIGEEVMVEFAAGLGQLVVPQGSQLLTGYYGVNPNLNVAPVAGPVPPETSIDLTIGLPVQNPAGLQTFIKQVSDPRNGQFRKHLSQAQFAAAYGAPAADYQALQAWATSNGFQIQSTYPTNLLLRVTGTAETIQRALYVNLVFRYRSDGSQFVAVDRDPSIDLAVPILEVGGLADAFVVRSGAQLGTGTAAAYRAADLRTAYLGVNSPNQALDGTGQVVGILGMDTLNLNDVTGPNGYASLQRPAPGQSPLPTPNVTLVNSSGSIGLEGTADVELVLAMAPAAHVIFFHGSTGITGHADDALHAMANSTPKLTSASCSWVFGRSDNSQQALDQMAALGVSFFTLSMDFGDVGDPQSNQDMDNQTLVGGTILNTNGLTSPLPNPVYSNPFYAFEQTWNQATAPQQKAVTGGGVMNGDNEAGDPFGGIIGIANQSGAQNCYCWPYPGCCGSGVPIPDYQVAVQQSSLGGNGGSQQFRNYPDVAMVATNIEVFFQGNPTSFAGTSASTPLWAGYMALVNQNSIANGQGLCGFLNPTLYDIGLTRGTAVDLFSLCFNNIHDGVSNFDGFGQGFISVPGYNLCTGWGSPTSALLDQLSTLTPLTPNQPLVLIQISITTGGDDAGGGQNGSEQTATVLLQDGGSFTLTLRRNFEAHWDNWTTHTIAFPIPATDSFGNPIPPLTPVSGIAGIQINLVQNNPSFAADNWDIFALRVSLSTPGFPPVCQLCLVGTATLQDGSTGLVRLSQSAGGSGNGPNSPVFSPTPAPPAAAALTQIQFIVATGNDDLGGGQNGSSATATVFVSGGGSFTVTLRSSNAPRWGNWTSNTVVAPVPATDDHGNPVPPLTPESGITGVQINLVQNNPSFAADNWDIFALEVSLLSADSSVQVSQLCLVGTATLQDGSIGLDRLSLTAGSSGVGPSTPVFATGPGSGCGG